MQTLDFFIFDVPDLWDSRYGVSSKADDSDIGAA